MIKNSIGASIEKITVCINDTTLTTLLDNIDIDESFFVKGKIENSKVYIKEKLQKYIKGLQSFNCTKSVTSHFLKLYTAPLSSLFDDGIVETFVGSIGKGFTLAKYLKIKLQTKEQHRDGVYDRTNDKEARNSILFEFNLSKYKEYTNRDDGIEYVLPLIKMLLFLDINITFPELIIQTAGSMITLIEELSSKVDNSIVTSFKLTNTLNSSDLLFEDYFYELTQLEMDSSNKRKHINYRKQKITFRIDSFKQYGKIKTLEEQEDEIFKSAKKAQKRDRASVAYHNEQESELAYDTGAAAAHGLDLDTWFDEDESEEDNFDNYVEGTRIYKAKMLEKTCKIDTVMVFLKDDLNKHGKGIKIYFQVQGAPNVNKLIYPVESEIENINNETLAKPSQETIHRIYNSTQEIFSNGLYSFFLNMSATDNDFEDIKKPNFTPNINFIKKDCVDTSKQKQDNLIPKIIFTILIDSGAKALKNSIWKFLGHEQKTELNSLVGKLNTKRYNYNKKDKAIISLCKYFEGEIDAK